jgi:hypothetical protein
MPCLSGKFDPQIGLLISVGIARAGDLTPPAEKPIIQFPALIDTGASHTCISRTVVQSVALRPVGMRPMSSATHSVPVNVYLVDLLITFGNTASFIGGTQVMEFISPPPPDGSAKPVFQVLLGRDILCQGVLTLSFDGHFTFSL